MRLKPQSRWGAWVATLAAYLTAFQLIFAVLPPPAHAAASGVDAGPFICGQDGAAERTDRPRRQNAPHHAPECCLFGCAMLGGLLPPVGAALPFRSVWALRLPRPTRMNAFDVRPERSPRLTRGPPGNG